MEKAFIRGDTPDEKFNSIDRILASFNRRLGKKVVGIIPPIPILHGARKIDEDGRIFAAVSPLNGTITTACYSIAKYYKRSASIELSITKLDGTTTTKKFSCRKPVEVFEPNLVVHVADVIRLHTDPASVDDILIGLLLHAEIEQTRKTSMMLNELLQLEEGSNHASEN